MTGPADAPDSAPQRPRSTNGPAPTPTPDPDRSFQHALRCARACDDLRGRETVVLDLTGVTPLFDFFVITNANSARQMRAIAEEADRLMKDAGSPRLGVEGARESNWTVRDYGDVVLHVFTPETRKLYDLEALWADARRVDWQPVAPDDDRPN